MKNVLISLSYIFLLIQIACKSNEVLNTTADIPPTIVANSLGDGKVSFTAVGENIVSYKWDFGDKSDNDVTSNPIHQFKFNGEYKVVLIAQVKVGKNLLQHTVSKIYTVSDIKDQTPSFTYVALESGKIQFNLYAPFLKSIKWDFGDRTPETTEQNPSHVYRFNGDYNVRIIVIAEAKDGDKQHIITQKVSVAGLKDATPKFNLTLKTDNKTVVVTNPAPYLKKITYEFIDPYEPTIKSDLNGASHTFPWNVENTVKMTALVEAKNGDTTYIDIQKIKITGNPKPEIVVGSVGQSADVAHIAVRMDRFSSINFNLGDGNYAIGSIDSGNNKVSDKPVDGTIEYNFPYNAVFKAEITMTNPNGTTSKKFDINVNSTKFNYQQSVTIPAEGFKYTLLSSPTIRAVTTEKVHFASEFYLRHADGSYYDFLIYSTNSSSIVNGPLISKINPVFNSLKTTAIYDFGSIAFSGVGSGSFSFKLLSTNSNNIRNFICLRNRNNYGSILVENLTISNINNFSINSSNWYSKVFVESGKLAELIREVFDNNLFNFLYTAPLGSNYRHEPNLKIRF